MKLSPVFRGVLFPLLCLVGSFSYTAEAQFYTTGVQAGYGVAFSGGGSDVGIAAWTQPNLGGDGAEEGLNINETIPGLYMANLLLTDGNGTLGIPFEYYGVSAGTLIDSSIGSAGTPLTPTGDFIIQPGVPFYLAIDIDPNGTYPPDDRFGWAELEINSSGFQTTLGSTLLTATDPSAMTLLGSALTSGQGIYAGTTTVVPEPSEWLLLPMGLLGLQAAYRRSKRTGAGV